MDCSLFLCLVCSVPEESPSRLALFLKAPNVSYVCAFNTEPKAMLVQKLPIIADLDLQYKKKKEKKR